MTLEENTCSVIAKHPGSHTDSGLEIGGRVGFSECHVLLLVSETFGSSGCILVPLHCKDQMRRPTNYRCIGEKLENM